MQTRYVKPNMANLKGKKGKAVIAEIRSVKVTPIDDIRKEADACMNRILAIKRNAK